MGPLKAAASPEPARPSSRHMGQVGGREDLVTRREPTPEARRAMSALGRPPVPPKKVVAPSPGQVRPVAPPAASSPRRTPCVAPAPPCGARGRHAPLMVAPVVQVAAVQVAADVARPLGLTREPPSKTEAGPEPAPTLGTPAPPRSPVAAGPRLTATAPTSAPRNPRRRSLAAPGGPRIAQA